MPEKTKLEDYTNMNNTGFAFIDLNEELKENIKRMSENSGVQQDCIHAYYEDTETSNIILSDVGNIYGYEIKNLYNKLKKIYESEKPLIVKVKFDVLDGNNDEHKYFDTIIRNCVLYKKETTNYIHYEIIINMGSVYSPTTGTFTSEINNILRVVLEYNKTSHKYEFSTNSY